MDEPRAEKKVKERNVYYTIYWPALRKVNKYDIHNIVPETAGIFELFFKNEDDKKQHLFFIGKVWLGGLRSYLRRYTDPLLLNDYPELRYVLLKYKCYYRYVSVDTLPDITDIEFYLYQDGGGYSPDIVPSGRYENVFCKEITIGGESEDIFMLDKKDISGAGKIEIDKKIPYSLR